MLEEEYNPRRKLPAHLRAPRPAEPGFAFEIRDATDADIPHIRAIYNHYVLNSTVTFDEKPKTHAAMLAALHATNKRGFPWLVAVSPRGEVLGYATVTPWKSKAAYRYTVENSIYLGPAATGKGLGRALMSELLLRAKAAGIREVIAVIADRGAEASIAMHESFGFTKQGHMGRVGFKFGRSLGTVFMQKSLS
ncbi:MAG TPA: GNAT family N-acetyltransferase [Pseudolysinimonas sp.]|nr:GNAT family N-acetyltransferase [Pseudolysinimonas sp.]